MAPPVETLPTSNTTTTKTYFDRLDTTFSQALLPNNQKNGIDTVHFLAATEGLIKTLDLLESAAFGPVKSDLSGNVKKIRDKYNTNPTKYITLQSIVLDEAQTKQRPTIEGLLWLKRGLEFCAKALRENLNHPSEELSTSFTKAYEATLKQYHSFVVRPIFTMAMKACPSRASFYSKLGKNVDEIHKSMDLWLKGLEEVLKILIQFYVDGKYEN